MFVFQQPDELGRRFLDLQATQGLNRPLDQGRHGLGREARTSAPTACRTGLAELRLQADVLGQILVGVPLA